MTSTDAFLLLQVFRRRALPTLLRRLHLWKGLDVTQHADLLEDLHQELWLDCLEHPDIVVALTARERHARWFRLVEQKHYQLHTRAERLRQADARLDTVPAPQAAAGVVSFGTGGPAATGPVADDPVADDPVADDPARGATPAAASGPDDPDPIDAVRDELCQPQRRFLRKLSASARYLKNGRINNRASASSLGVRPRELQSLWSRVAADLGFGDEFLQFWRRRLVEALTGLAADLLRDRGVVTLHGESQRRRPDPRGRLHRIRQLRNHLSCRPMPRDLKHVLVRYHRTGVALALDPREILADAASLLPDEPAVHLWSFEAHLAERDLAGALAAIRNARAHGADRVRVRLARARLLGVRDREHAALRLLSRGAAAERHDARLRDAIRRLAC